MAEVRAASKSERDPGAAPKPPGRARGGRAPKPVGNEVSYSGRVFRSKLEARWAAYLDLLQVNWDYEPSHYQIGPSLFYLPDFYLPDLGVWLEVKGAPFMDAASMAKVAGAVAGPMRIPMREAPYSPIENMLLGGMFRPVPEHSTPVHTLVFHAAEHEVSFAPVTFQRTAGSWVLVPVGKPWGKMAATGVPARRRPAKAVLDQLLEPPAMKGEPDPFMLWAYEAARKLKFDPKQGRLLPSDNAHEVLSRLVRRRAGRPLPQALWPKNYSRV